MLISTNLHKKSSEVSIKTRSTPASLSFIGQVFKHTTVKWTIGDVAGETELTVIEGESHACWGEKRPYNLSF